MPALRLQPRTPTTAAKASFVFHFLCCKIINMHLTRCSVRTTCMSSGRPTCLTSKRSTLTYDRKEDQHEQTQRQPEANADTTLLQSKSNKPPQSKASLIDSKAILWKATGTTDPDVPSKPGKLKLAKLGK